MVEREFKTISSFKEGSALFIIRNLKKREAEGLGTIFQSEVTIGKETRTIYSIFNSTAEILRLTQGLNRDELKLRGGNYPDKDVENEMVLECLKKLKENPLKIPDLGSLSHFYYQHALELLFDEAANSGL